MELNKLSGDDLYGYLGVPVKLELNVNDQPICGNVYTIDPETHSIVLMQFQKSDAEKPDKLVWVPGSTIKLMHELNDDELLDGCAPSSSEHIELIEKLVLKTIGGDEKPAEDESVIEERLKRLTEFLKSKNVPFTQDKQIIKIGPVQLESPYRADNLKSGNLVALQRTQKMLASVLS